VSVLLREAHGFERLSLVTEERDANDLAIAKLDVPGQEERDRQSADSAHLVLAKPNENSIPNSFDPLHFDPHIAPRREPGSRTPSGPKYTRAKSSSSHSMPRVSKTMLSSRNLALVRRSPRLVNASNSSRTRSTFSCDIAYSDRLKVSPSPIDLTSSDTLSLSLNR
jgi:hypothetical protein